MTDLWAYQTKTRKFSKLRVGGVDLDAERVHAPMLSAEDEAEILGSYEVINGSNETTNNKIMLIGGSENNGSVSASTAEPELIEYFTKAKLAETSDFTMLSNGEKKRKPKMSKSVRTPKTKSSKSSPTVTKYLEQSTVASIVLPEDNVVAEYDGGVDEDDENTTMNMDIDTDTDTVSNMDVDIADITDMDTIDVDDDWVMELDE